MTVAAQTPPKPTSLYGSCLRINSDKIPLPQATEDFKNRLGITVEIDPAMPKDEIHFVSKSPEGDRIIHRIRLT